MGHAGNVSSQVRKKGGEPPRIPNMWKGDLLEVGWRKVLTVAAFIGVLGLLMMSGARITGLSFLLSSPVGFVEPTPLNGSMHNLPWVIVNVSDENNLSLAVLSWQGQNVSMEVDARGAVARVNGSGVIPFSVFTLYGDGSTGSTGERVITLTYLNWSIVPDQVLPEDSRLDMDLWIRVESVKPKAGVGFSVAQDRTDQLLCSLDQARFLNCTAVPEATGSTAVTLTADDGVAAVSVSFNATVVPVNDPPRFVASFSGKSMKPRDEYEIDLTSMVVDPEGDALFFAVVGADAVPVRWISSKRFRFEPNASSVGSFNVSVVANDSRNATFSPIFRIEVRPNLAPAVTTKLTVLKLNASRAYSLKFHQIFEDPDDDELMFWYENLSLARTLRRSNTLFIVPHENRSGTENLVMMASDGDMTTRFSLPVMVFPSSPLLPQPSMESVSGGYAAGLSVSSEQVAEPVVIPSQGGGAAGVPVPAVSGSQEQGNGLPAQQVPAQSPVPAAQVPVAVEQQLRKPVLLKPLPSLVFDENSTNASFNLEEYWSDPVGKGLEFLIEPKEGIVTRIQSRNVAVISLASSGQAVANNTVKILAKDADGNIVTGKVLVTVNNSASGRFDAVDLILIAAILLTLVVIVGMLTTRVLPALMHRDERSAPAPVAPSPQQPASLHPFAALGRPRQARALVQNALSEIVSRCSLPGRLDEPSELKSVAMLLREAHAILKIIISSTDDDLVEAALVREEEKLSRALSIMRGKAELSPEEMRRILLYVKEASVCIAKINEVADEQLIVAELSREAARLDTIARLLEVKMVYKEL